MNKRIVVIIFIISCLIHCFYFVSAYWTHTLDPWFEHDTMGQDFFAIPNAAYAFLHGGNLQGQLPLGVTPYTDCCAANNNVYHPLFTLLIGIPLQMLPPWTAFYTWGAVHFLTSLFIVFFLWKKFSKNTHLYLAASIYLLNSYQYYEIQHAQFHILFNLCMLLFLYEIDKHGDTTKAGIYLFLSFLVKPIGLLFIIPLLLYRYWKTVIVALVLFSIVTIPLYTAPMGKYYITNILHRSESFTGSYNFIALEKFVPAEQIPIRFIVIVVTLFLFGYQIIVTPPIVPILSLWLIFQLLFNNSVFHYYYTVLAILIPLTILLGHIKNNILDRTPVIFLTIPTPIIFLHLAGATAVLPVKQLSAIALWSVFWVIWLATRLVVNMWPSIKNIEHRASKFIE